uniref:Fibronectin type-III domain-containing protein n=3 Tax=Kalanchoe fedtschenkoi TaxID=63787 RepID=A0A7N0TBZ4_KALFE
MTYRGWRLGNWILMTKLRRMDLEDKLLTKASGVQSLSSSVHSTPEKNGHSDDASRSPELLHEFVKYGPRKDLARTCSDREKKQSASSKSKMIEQFKTSNKSSKKQEQKKTASSLYNNSSLKKQPRKGDNPTRFPKPDDSSDFGCSTSWICKNSACRARMSLDDAFCKRCSCCICHLFDENKDPSLWLECASEFGVGYSCGLSCHIECALQRKKVGVVNLGQLMQLDGSYCCTWCGKVSDVLGSWKKQLVAAKDARRVDILCYRVLLSYRLLDGTSKFKEMHEIVSEAKEKLEMEVGPLNEISSTMHHRGIVSRLSVANDVQNLCSLAIRKTDDLLDIEPNQEKCRRGTSLPAACRFIFQNVTCSSVVIVLVELSNSSSENIRGYKLWYFKSRDEKEASEPMTVLSRSQKRIMISNLQPCTEYTFEVVSYTESGDLGHSVAKCFTKSIEIIHKNSVPGVIPHCQNGNSNGGQSPQKESEPTTGVQSSEFKVRDLGKVLQVALAQEQDCAEGLTAGGVEKSCGASETKKPEMKEQFPCGSRGCLDLNVASVPDLNEALIPPFEDSRDGDNDCVVSHDIEKDSQTRSRVSSDSQIWVHAPAIDSQLQPCRKRLTSTNEETHDCDSALIDNSLSGVSNGSGGLDENFEYCVKMIRWLECEGHIDKEFRLKLLTWYSMRSTEQERRVVSTFVQTLIDDPSSLAAQLIDSFSDIISSKRPCHSHSKGVWP